MFKCKIVLLYFFVWQCLLYAQELQDQTFVIFGNDSQSEQNFSPEQFESFFKVVRPLNPDALFFIGQFYRNKTELEIEEIFQKVNQSEKSQLGFNVPFYPVWSSKEIPLDLVKSYMAFFGIKVSLVGESLVYPVLIHDVLFIILAKNDFSSEVLDWLDDYLRRNKKNDQLTLVLGNECVFDSIANLHQQTIKMEQNKKNFWNILKRHQVMAYICDNSSTYERTVRDDVWHINLGTMETKTISKSQQIPVSQFLVLKVPPNKSESPQILMIDEKGAQKDKFNLNQKQSPIFQLRVSWATH